MIVYTKGLWDGDARLYLHDREGELECYRLLYPAFGTYAAGYATKFLVFPSDPILTVALEYGLIVPGHVAGRLRAAARDEHYDEYDEAGARRSTLPSEP